MSAKRTLGATGIEVTPIGLGTWQLSGARGFHGLFWKDVPQAEVDALVRAALDGGIDWFDTAEIYGSGKSEESLAAALKASGRQDAKIATKWWPLLRTARSIRSTIDRRLRTLGGFPITLYQIHQPISFSSVESEMDAMADLVNAGKIGAIGVSNYSAAAMRRAHAALARRGLPLASNQVRHSLLDRTIERDGTLAAARELGVTIIAYSPLAQGLLTGKLHEDPRLFSRLPLARRLSLRPLLARSAPLVAELGRIAAAHGASASQVALAWTIAFHGDVVVAIPGASKTHHAADAAAALGVTLSTDELARIDALSRAATKR